jgi:branched-subunit amino acid transport protein AzlD
MLDLHSKTLFIMCLIAGTQLTRFIPLFVPQIGKLIEEKKKLNFSFFIAFFLVIYCYRDFSLSSEYYLRVICGAVVFLTQWFTEKSLLSIFVGTVSYILLLKVML